MASSGSNADVTGATEDVTEPDAKTEFLGAGPADALEKNSAAEDAFSPE
jgi:hypothetical protein